MQTFSRTLRNNAAIAEAQSCSKQRYSCMDISELLLRINQDLRSSNENVRWQAAIALGSFAEHNPELIWPTVVAHGSRRHADVRSAIATCVLEHILEYHFDAFFPRVKQA